jgi:hypothetical protein
VLLMLPWSAAAGSTTDDTMRQSPWVSNASESSARGKWYLNNTYTHSLLASRFSSSYAEFRTEIRIA